MRPQYEAMTDDALDLPLEVPSTLDELELAIMLLGNLAQQGKLRPSRRAQLVKLVGGYPSPTQASAWKQALKGLRADMAELDAAHVPRRRVSSVATL